MLHQGRKFICSLLALVLLLAPIEFVVAHDAMMSTQQADQIEMQHHGMTMDDEATELDCDGQGVCSDCVYCSPALSLMILADVEKLVAEKLPTVISRQYSIDLPVAHRPPKQL